MYSNLGIIGYPLTHTLSPFIHNYFLYHTQINGGYAVFETKDSSDISATVALFKKYNFLGVNVTLPYKELIIEHADILDHSAKILGACNTLKFSDGMTTAYNTDLFGIEQLFLVNDIDFTSKKVLLLGAGGAARSVIAALNNFDNVEIIIANRSKYNADNVAKLSNNLARVVCYEDIIKTKCDYVINSTSMGIVDKKFPDLGLDVKYGAIDLQYGKNLTPFLTTLSDANVKLIDGLDMLIFQAYRSFQIWTDVAPDIDFAQLRERIKTSV